ncbi:MAG TPA: HD domain-containing phosphohydrolase [Candidatus Acidoferrales bacterium]|nr:HD domain-containing phosphohydrolase [Candidatus Acidoferrales bacterium]
MNSAILLVDVASASRDSWKSFLQSHNYEVFTADNGESAVRECLQLQPDLVLLYDGPPDVDAFDVCRRMKGNPLNHELPIVLTKPSPQPADVARGQEAGAADFWGTCSSFAEALSRVQSLLRLKTYIDEQAKAVVLSLARSIEAKHPLMNGHSDRIANYAVHLGSSVGLPEEELEELRIACLLHDVGKVAVPDEILLKPGALNAAETKIVRQHPVIGESICAPLKSLRRILPVIRHHHERMDGSGYPDGLCGHEIPLMARILQIADIYDALITDRPYRDALSSEQALETLNREAGYGWLDDSLVLKFSQICRYGEYVPVIGRSMLASYYA